METFENVRGGSASGGTLRFPVQKHLRAYYSRRLLKSLFWAAFWLVLWLAAIEFFYGPGAELWAGIWDGATYLVGMACGVWLMGILVSFGCLIARLIGFVCCTGSLRRSMKRYLPEGTDLRNPYELLNQDIRCRLQEGADIYLGCDWVLFAGQAMKRDDVAGVFVEDLSKRYLSRKHRLQLVDDKGRGMYIDLSRKQSPLYIYGRLIDLHPRGIHGDARAREGVGAISAFQLSQKVRREEPEAPLGFSRWDKSPILEENPLRFDYERWLLASYSLYIAGDPYHNGDFSRVGGYERTVYQRTIAREVLEDPWEVKNKTELLDTVRHLITTGRARRDGWQLGRAPMVLGFGYIAELITREELLEYSLDAALAIQQTFSGWQALFDSYLESYAAWVKSKPVADRRRRVLRELLRDPASPLNTVPFQADLPALYREVQSSL